MARDGKEMKAQLSPDKSSVADMSGEMRSPGLKPGAVAPKTSRGKLSDMTDPSPSAGPPDHPPAVKPFARFLRPFRFVLLPIAYVISVWMYTALDGYSVGEGAIRSLIPAAILLCIFVFADRKLNR
jgi:hypothetical protein